MDGRVVAAIAAGLIALGPAIEALASPEGFPSGGVQPRTAVTAGRLREGGPPPGSTARRDGGPPPRETRLEVRDFRVVQDTSGPENYYQVIEEQDPKDSFIHSAYRPPLETVTLAVQVPERLRQRVHQVRWRWRAVTIPKGGNECKDGYGDSAAVVYVTFKRGFKWYSLKYVWSDDAKKGESCRQKRNPFVAQDVIVLQSGGPLNTWRTEQIDPSADFRAHFADNDLSADVPDFVGIGIMSDGDQTNSFSSADFGGFTLIE